MPKLKTNIISKTLTRHITLPILKNYKNDTTNSSNITATNPIQFAPSNITLIFIYLYFASCRYEDWIYP